MLLVPGAYNTFPRLNYNHDLSDGFFLEVSRVLALTQSDYVFVNFFGTLRAYSIASGTLVICNPEEADEELWSRGCQLSHRQSFLRKSSLMSLGHHNGGTLILSHSQVK